MRYEWSKEEERYLMQNYRNHTAQEIADKLGRSERSVYFRASLFAGISVSRSYSSLRVNTVPFSYIDCQ